MTESEWTRGLCRDLEKLGAVTLALVAGGKSRGQMMQAPGWPDRWLCHPLWTGWLEMKMRASLTLLQAERIRAINERWPGGAYVVRWTPECVEIQDHESRPLKFVRDSASALLRGLFELQMRDDAWVEERQAMLGELYGRLGR